jgi:D-glycero-D-manno-heptose 1,7-bisphosphate phosphatase
MNRRPVVFLDRDGTLNVEAGYLRNLDDLVLIEGAAEAVKKLNQNGIAAVLVTNQSGAARGYYSEEHIRNLNARLLKLLSAQGAFLDGSYYCPHLADGEIATYRLNCLCRKPQPGMIDTAFAEHPDLDRALSFVVGDKATDVELARNCGARAVLVLTGYGRDVIKGSHQWQVKADFEAPSIVEAVDWILVQSAQKEEAPKRD